MSVQSSDDGEKHKRELEILIRSRYPIIYVVSWEEKRVIDTVVEIGAHLGKKVFTWSCLSGLLTHAMGSQPLPKKAGPSKDPIVALQDAVELKESALFVFKDFHPFLTGNNMMVVRALREIAQAFTSSFKTIIIVGPTLHLPPELEKDISVVDFPLPGAKELNKLLDNAVREISANPKLKIDLDGESREEVIRATHGLTLSEAESVFAKALVVFGRLGPQQIPAILEEKRQIIRKSGLLDYVEPEVGIGDVGGLENLKDWLVKRRLAFSDKARLFGLPPPRGVLMLGVQGCGKSLCVKAVSAMWKLPLLRLDVGRIFNSLVGGSEENIRRAITIAEGVSPCILWVDEIDKAFGAMSGTSTDSGTSQRILGTFLVWLAEKSSSVFVAATANNVESLPPELLRKGRFDEIFFVDLPDRRERENIFSIHFQRRRRDPAKYGLARLAEAAEGFSGAEIEQAVISGMFDAFYDGGREVETADVVKAIQETVPLSRTMEERIEKLRDWCHNRARPASAGLPGEDTRSRLSDLPVNVEGELL